MIQMPFLTPRLIGARFEGHAIPLEFLKDLAVLDEMIVEVAKAEYLKEFPGRKRTPRGFTEDVDLKLTEVKEGSAKLKIVLVIAATAVTLLPPYNQAYFERARDTVLNAITAAEQNRTITDYLPEEKLSYFDRMGRSLREGEVIEFTSPARLEPARLTKEIRRKLVLASSQAKELTEEISIRGTVPEADQHKMSFEIQLPDGRRIHAPMAPQHFDTIMGAFNGYRFGSRVLFQGIGKFNRYEKLTGFESIEHVSVLDALDVPARLDELRTLKDGWVEGGGRAPTSAGMDWFSQVFSRNYPEDLALPYLYPTEEGGIQAEWSLGSNEITLEINLESHAGLWHALNLETEEVDTKQLNIDEDQAWLWLTDRIKRMAGDAV